MSKANGLPQEDIRNSEEFDVDTLYMTRCAVSCVVSARELIKLVHRTSQSKSTDAWWYNVYCKLASVLVLLTIGSIFLIILDSRTHFWNGHEISTALQPFEAGCKYCKSR